MSAERPVNEAGGRCRLLSRRAWAVALLALLTGSTAERAAGPVPAPAGVLRLVSRQGHAGQITSAVLSADGSLALTAASDKQAILWDLATGRPLRHFLARTSFKAAALGPNNDLIVATDGRDAVIWDARTGRLVARLTHHKGPLTAVDLSANGKRLLTTSGDGTAALWKLPTGPKPQPLRVFPGPGDQRLMRASMDRAAGHVLTYHYIIRKQPQGRGLVPETSAILWDAETGKRLFELKGDKKPLITAHLSPDGAAVVTTHALGLVSVWSAKGVKIDEFGPPRDPSLVAHVGFGGGSRRVLVAWVNDAHSVRDTRAKRTLWKFSPARRPDSLMKSAISPDGKTVVLWNEPALEFHDVDTSEQLHQFFFGFQNRVRALSMSEDSKMAIAGFADGNAAVLATRRGRFLVPLVSATSPYKALAVTERGVRSVTQERDGGLDATIPAFLDWPLGGPVTKQNLLGNALERPATITRLALMDPAGDRLLTAGFGSEIVLWELPSCKPRRLKGSSRRDGWVTALAFGPNGGFAAGSDGEAFIYSPGAKPPVHLKPIAGTVGLVAFSADGRRVFTRSNAAADGKPDIEEALWHAATGRRLAHIPPRQIKHKPQLTPAPAPVDPEPVDTDRDPVWDEGGTEELVVTNRNGPNRLLPDGRRLPDILRDGQNGRFIALFPCWASTDGRNAPAVSPKGDLVATVKDRTVILWDTAKKSFCRRCELSQGVITTIAFRPNGKALIGACRDALRAWDTATGRELAVFTVMDRYVHWVEGAAIGVINPAIPAGPQRVDKQRLGNWLVATREGRVDTGGIDESGPFSWVFSDKPFRALPPEMFTRDYFEPRLLSKILAGEPLPPIGPPIALSRAQPRVAVTSVTDGSRLGAVDVTVTVEPVEGSVSRGGRRLPTKTVHDLRLIRNRQLVAQEPLPKDPGPPAAADADLTAWDHATRLRPRPGVVEEKANGRMVVTFRDVQLPSRPRENIAFTAYAFNADRVKSALGRPRTFPVPPAIPPKKGRAYIICVGVGTRDAVSGLNEPFEVLSFTPASAKLVLEELQKVLKGTGAYDKVASVLLASNDRWEDRTAIRPTKGNIRTVLGLLAGVRDEKGLARIPQALRDSMLKDIERATPDDLVVFYFSGHGYSNARGDFYLIPYDSGANPGPVVRPEVLKRSISGQELAYWLRDIDAGETSLIIDSCNSGAVSPVKPAPLGDRGLGQFAYDKAMSVLAAVQADIKAKSIGALQSSLLTYTLAVEGLAKGKGLIDGRLSMSALFEFVVSRAPAVWREKVSREFNQGQLPVLLDFSHRITRGAAGE